MLLQQVQRPRDRPNHLWRLPVGLSDSESFFFVKKRLQKVNSRKCLHFTDSTIQKPKLKRSGTASWLFRFGLCVSPFLRKTSISVMCLKKTPPPSPSPITTTSYPLHHPVSFSAEQQHKTPPNSPGDKTDVTERGFLLEHSGTNTSPQNNMGT